VKATAELAMALLKEDRTAEAQTLGVKSLKAGPVEIGLDDTFQKAFIPPAVMAYIQPYLQGGGTCGRVVRS
jgi:hypothetical protein